MLDGTLSMMLLVDWQVFCTFTWRSSKLGTARSRENQLWDFLKTVTADNRNGVPFCELPVVVRWERGELGDRPHAHALLAGLERVSIDWCFRQSARWFTQYGLARWRITTTGGNVRRDSVLYMAKAKAMSRADRYELGKFSHADRLVVNPAAWQEMCRRAGVDHVPQHRTSQP